MYFEDNAKFGFLFYVSLKIKLKNNIMIKCHFQTDAKLQELRLKKKKHDSLKYFLIFEAGMSSFFFRYINLQKYIVF